MGTVQFRQVGALTEQPAHDNMSLFVGAFFRIHCIGFLDANRGKITFLLASTEVHWQTVKSCQCQFFKIGLQFFSRNVAIGHENGIAGMIMRFVELLQFPIAQVRNVCRFAATVVMVSGAGKEVAAHGLPEAGNG